ncbi:hypothetical protein BJ508DRAFT_332290 [Ascobolus immersus RN42]|uniref:Uncharacterized protein n=1 Tax=Ascobolus immersus RN42 TaxID=1160509 RepID=A0A3N4HN43_ASCIM|nr:hypothetical protein BJ508DRAFT_332290 [Ascobolus immersus RN42]
MLRYLVASLAVLGTTLALPSVNQAPNYGKTYTTYLLDNPNIPNANCDQHLLSGGSLSPTSPCLALPSSSLQKRQEVVYRLETICQTSLGSPTHDDVLLLSRVLQNPPFKSRTCADVSPNFTCTTVKRERSASLNYCRPQGRGAGWGQKCEILGDMVALVVKECSWEGRVGGWSRLLLHATGAELGGLAVFHS